MARKTVVVSDLSGEVIDEGSVARITVTFSDARRSGYTLDVSEQEAEGLGHKGMKQRRGGRKERT